MYRVNLDTRSQFLPQILPQTKSIVTININFRLRDYKDKEGKQLIYAHLTAVGKRKRLSTDLKIHPKDWDDKRGMPKRYMADEILILEDIKSKFYSIVKRHRLNNQMLTLDILGDEYKSNLSGTDFIQFCWKIWEDQCKVIKPGTSRRYKSVIQKIESWKKEIPFSTITYDLIKRFEQHLIKLGNKEETIASNMRCFKKYLTEAERYGINIPVQLTDIKISQVKSRRQGLPTDELKKLYDYYCSEFISERYRLSLGYFLFSCFTSLRVSDILKLERKDIKDNFIIQTNKTGSYVNINLTGKSKKVLEICPELFERKISPEKINENLKGVAAALQIQTPLSMHVGRHTFGENFMRLGGSLIDLKNIMGHSSITQTEQYAKIAKLESSKHMKLIDDVF